VDPRPADRDRLGIGMGLDEFVVSQGKLRQCVRQSLPKL
jgi:hypothetical protein